MNFCTIDHPKFISIMSRDGKRLREEVMGLCIRHGTSGLTKSEYSLFEQTIINNYDPVIWERAILYAHPSEIVDAVLRVTSASFWKSEPGKISNGSKNGARYKNTDWLGLATKFDPNLWMKSVQNPRNANKIDPISFNKHREEFSNIYTLFVNWLIVDFSYTTLFNIYDISRRFSVDLVHDCMLLVSEPRQRSVDYLRAVIEKEMAARKIEMLDNKELLDGSKKMLETLIEMVNEKGKPVDWNSIEENMKIDDENKDMFDKVKLS